MPLQHLVYFFIAMYPLESIFVPQFYYLILIENGIDLNQLLTN